jgi:L-fucose dehydrogenase
MNLQLQDKVVLIAGGASEIAAATACAVAQEGAVPVIVDRDAESRDRLRAELHRNRAKSVVISTDLTSPENCSEAVNQTVKDLGKIDALINHAGVTDRIGLEHGTHQQYIGSLQRNLIPFYNMAHYALPHLKRTRGTIVNICSNTAIAIPSGATGTASCKGAILALTREWAVELLPYGIRVNAVVQGARTEEAAAMVVFLISSKAEHITGQHLFV